MSLFNEIQVGRYSTLLQKLFSIKGAAPAPQLAGEIMPTFPIEVDRPEWKFLAGERIAAGGGTDAAVAGENCHVVLVNPAQSSSLIVVEECIAIPSTATSIYFGRGPIPSGAGVAQLGTGFRDYRLPDGTGITTGQTWTKTQVGLAIVTVTDRRIAVAGNAERVLKYPIVLPPNSAYWVGGITVNTSITAIFVWRERKIEQDELAVD